MDRVDSLFWVVFAVAIVIAVLVIVDAVLLVRRRKSGRFGNLVTWIDTVLLLAGVQAVIGFVSLYHTYGSIARADPMNVAPIFLNSTLMIHTCGFLFIAAFFTWAVLRLLFNRAVAGTTIERAAAPAQG